jgi:hypothetical protein
VNNSTSSLLVFKMKLPTQMCHFFWLGCTISMYGNHTWSL